MIAQMQGDPFMSAQQVADHAARRQPSDGSWRGRTRHFLRRHFLSRLDRVGALNQTLEPIIKLMPLLVEQSSKTVEVWSCNIPPVFPHRRQKESLFLQHVLENSDEGFRSLA